MLQINFHRPQLLTHLVKLLTSHKNTLLSYRTAQGTRLFSEQNFKDGLMKRRHVFCYENCNPRNMKNIILPNTLEKVSFNEMCQYYQNVFVKIFYIFIHFGSA